MHMKDIQKCPSFGEKRLRIMNLKHETVMEELMKIILQCNMDVFWAAHTYVSYNMAGTFYLQVYGAIGPLPSICTHHQTHGGVK